MKSVKSCSSRIGLGRLARTRLRTLSCFFSQTRACVCLGCSPFRIERCWECCDPLHVVGSFCFHAHGQAWNEGWWREVARVPGMATCNMDFSCACAFVASPFLFACRQPAAGAAAAAAATTAMPGGDAEKEEGQRLVRTASEWRRAKGTTSCRAPACR